MYFHKFEFSCHLSVTSNLILQWSENIVEDFNSFKFVNIRFMTQDMVYLAE